ncbi:HAMP domain-containing sensor histidine kinase [Oceanirhabdus seepicola]|uniref:histidine kinase n=1 Tax=Oceanirhabdus seepicola TaxID=2828781 RepID=A0A9J6P0G2_9CLOT|nr:HAMP domain-containing sensor histidine kinase [Oceanirhabdus seepicola]MCM1989609.1 HAMP domain-containing histidine kinase [Oceanirhabdus seepicola]
MGKKIRSSITIKVFLFTIIPIFLLILLLIISQYLFFNDFYINKKSKTLKSNTLGLKYTIDNYNLTVNSFKSYIYEFEEKNNAKVAILNSNGAIKFSVTPYDDNNILKEYDTINKAIAHWLNSDNYYKVLLSKETLTYQFMDPISKNYYSVIVSPLETYNPSILFVVSTLQPVDEANSILTQYYLYFIVAALIILVIVSIILSRMLTKPLIALNKTAKKMSNLEFNVKCNVTTNDELGSLGNSLNFMSKKLDTTLTDLHKANEQLIDDIEKERKLEKMRREFIGDISHELKTPISLVQGYAEALKDGIVDKDDISFYTDVIIEETNNLNCLVIDMLNLAKLENDPYSIREKKVNLSQFLRVITKKYSLMMQNHNFITNIDIDTSPYSIFDPKRIEEVLNNFLTNAKRYTKVGDKIIVSLKILNDDNFIISVENQGVQLNENDLNNIWNKFYRVDKSRNKASGGSGLGLSITKRILDLHKSIYGVVNTPNGLKFHFTLPVYSKKN